jgi:hypothetical protein
LESQVILTYYVYHRSNGAGSHIIRLKDPFSWSNHSSIMIADRSATVQELLETPLFEARSKIGVTGIRPDNYMAPNSRTLKQAIDGGDQVEVWQAFEVLPAQEFDAYEWLKRQVGKGYDMPGLAGFLPFTLLRNKVLERQKERKYEQAWWCSELKLAHSMQRGQPLLQNVMPFQVSPEDCRTSPMQAFTWGSHQDTPHVVK